MKKEGVNVKVKPVRKPVVIQTKAGASSGGHHTGRRNLRHSVEAPGVTYVRVLPENKAEERAKDLQATGTRWRNQV